MNPLVFMLAGTDDVPAARRPILRQTLISPGYDVRHLRGFARSNVGRRLLTAQPPMPDAARRPATCGLYNARNLRQYAPNAVGGTVFAGTQEESHGIAQALGAQITSLRAQIDTSSAYAVDPRLRAEALTALNQYAAILHPLKGRIEGEQYEAWGTNSARSINERIKRLKHDVDAFYGQVARFISRQQSAPTSAEAVRRGGESAAQAEQQRKEEEKPLWERYKRPIYVGAGVLGAVAVVYLFGPLIRGLGKRAAAREPAREAAA